MQPDAYDLGRVTVTFVANAITFGAATVGAAVALRETRLTPAKVVIAALVLGHLGTAILRFALLHGDDSNRWDEVGYACSRLLFGPLLGWLLWRRVGRWKAAQEARGEATPSTDDRPPPDDVG